MYRKQGRYEEALKSFEKAMEMYIVMHHGDNHPDVMMTISNIGGVYLSMGKYEQSLQCFDKALTKYLHTLGNILINKYDNIIDYLLLQDDHHPLNIYRLQTMHARCIYFL